MFETSQVVTQLFHSDHKILLTTVITPPSLYTFVMIFCSNYYVFVCPGTHLLNFEPYIIPHRQPIETLYDC